MRALDPHPSALVEMAKSDKYAAIVFVTSKPVEPFARRKWPEGFKFLPVPLTEKLEEYYLPAQLEPSDYPDLIPQGQIVQTISVPAVLAVYNWPLQSDRHRRVVRFIDYLFERLPRLQSEPGFHPKWRDLNLAATVPGWQRFGAMQDKLVAAAAAGTDFHADNAAKLKEAIARLAPGNDAEQTRLLQRFLRSQPQPPGTPSIDRLANSRWHTGTQLIVAARSAYVRVSLRLCAPLGAWLAFAVAALAASCLSL